MRIIRKRASIMLESVVLSTVALASILAFVHHFYSYTEKYSDPYTMTIDSAAIRAEAPVVIVGTITGMHDTSKQWSSGAGHWQSVGYYDLAVTAVERGKYGKDTITVAMGHGSDTAVPQIWPPYIKKKYFVGEDVRVYLDRDPAIGYYTPCLWFTIEPLR